MKKRTNYGDEPVGRLRIVPDFLPSPEQLALREEKVKITISLSRTSMEFFKEQAALHHTAYQRMIRNLLDAYADQHRASAPVNRKYMIAAESRQER